MKAWIMKLWNDPAFFHVVIRTLVMAIGSVVATGKVPLPFFDPTTWQIIGAVFGALGLAMPSKLMTGKPTVVAQPGPDNPKLPK